MFSFLLLFNPENLPRSISSMKFKWRNMGTLIGGEGKNSGVDGPSLSQARATSGKNMTSVLVTPKAVTWKGS